MATSNDAAAKHGGGDGGLERLTAVESRLSVIEKTMVTREVFELGGLRHEMRAELSAVRGAIMGLRGEVRVETAKIPFEVVKWLIALAGIAAAIATTIYNLCFR